MLPPELCSYRKGKMSCMNAAKLASDTYDDIERGEDTLVIALDLEDTCNRVQFNVLMHTLANLDTSPQLVRWIGTSLMKNKISATAISGHRHLFNTFKNSKNHQNYIYEPICIISLANERYWMIQCYYIGYLFYLCP